MATLNAVKLTSLYPSHLAPEPVAMCLNPHRTHTHVYSRLKSAAKQCTEATVSEPGATSHSVQKGKVISE